MRKSNFGSSSVQRQGVLKPRNSGNTPNSRLSAGPRKARVSSEGNSRLSQIATRFTPTRSNIPRYTPVRSNVPSSNTLAVPSSSSFATPASSTSRLSTDTVRNSSMGGKNRKETRPIGDPAFKSECVDKVLEFLAVNGFDYQVNRRTLLNPTTKDFTNIFTFIYSHLDPSYALPQKFEEEIPKLMKNLKYPSQLSKSTFISVGSRHTWTTVLAMLAWLIDALGLSQNIDPCTVLFPMDFDVESTIDQKRLEKYFSTYACRDDDELIAQDIEDYKHTVESLYEVRSQDMISLQEIGEKLDEEIATASSGPERLEQLNLQYEQLVNDKEKMICYNRELQVHMSAKDNERRQLESKFAEYTSEVVKINEQKDNLEAMKAQQALSASELSKFKNHAKDVDGQISQLEAQGKELDTQTWTTEMTLGKAQKELSGKISSYNALVNQLDLGENFGIESGNISEDLAYWKTQLLSLIYKSKKDATHKCYEAENHKIRMEGKLSMVQELLKEKKDEVHRSEVKLRRLDEENQLTKNEITAEEKEMHEEIERLHHQIVESRKGQKTSLYQKQATLDEAKMELESTKASGRTRMQKGLEFLLKVCNRAMEDLETRTKLVMEFKQGVKMDCKKLKDNMKHHKEFLENAMKGIMDVSSITKSIDKEFRIPHAHEVEEIHLKLTS